MSDPYLITLIEEIVSSKIGMTLGSADASGSLRADNGEMMELDATNEENVEKAKATWYEPDELPINALKFKLDPDPPPPTPLPVT